MSDVDSAEWFLEGLDAFVKRGDGNADLERLLRLCHKYREALLFINCGGYLPSDGRTPENLTVLELRNRMMKAAFEVLGYNGLKNE